MYYVPICYRFIGAGSLNALIEISKRYKDTKEYQKIMSNYAIVKICESYQNFR